MRIIIIEDESYAADQLEGLVRDHLEEQINSIVRLESVEESVDWFRDNPNPDLIFCDIHLSDGISFEIFQGTEVTSPVIFTTAYDKYALDAFKVFSIDYLLKPVDTEKLKAAIDKFQKLGGLKNSASGQLNIEDLMSHFRASANQFKTRIRVKKGDTLKSVQIDEVAYFYAEDGVVFLKLKDNSRYLVDHTLNDLESTLNPQDFFRLNRQFICHINAVKEIKPYFKGRLLVELDPSCELSESVIVSQSKAKDLKNWLDE